MRKLYMTTPLKQELQAWLKQLAQDEEAAPEKYDNCGLLLRQPNGKTVEQTLLRKKFQKWEAEHPEYGKISFHALQHSSATYQLRISKGDIKAVQGNTGHANAEILVNTYAHIQEEPRRRLHQRFEEDFYREQSGCEQAGAAPATALNGAMLLEIIRNADPEIKRALARALFA